MFCYFVYFVVIKFFSDLKYEICIENVRIRMTVSENDTRLFFVAKQRKLLHSERQILYGELMDLICA